MKEKITAFLSPFLILLILGLFIPLGAIAQDVTSVNLPGGELEIYPQIGLAVLNNTLYFKAYNRVLDTNDLYQYDGTTSPQKASGMPQYFNLFALSLYNNQIYLLEDMVGIYGYDGINAPTMISSDQMSGPFVEFNGNAFLSYYKTGYGWELCQWDGINSSILAVDIYPGTNGSNPHDLYVYNGKLYFSATTATGEKTFAYDGVNLTTITNTGGRNFIAFDGKLYFWAYVSPYYQLWAYDLNNSPVQVGNFSNPYASDFEVFNNRLYFFSDPENAEAELWSYDGTNAPTKSNNIPQPANPGFGAIDAGPFTVLDGKLYFCLHNNYDKAELWNCDNTNSVSFLAEIPANSTTQSRVTDLFSMNGSLYFATERGLWKYSSSPFSVLSPNGKGQWQVGSTQMITWTAPVSVTQVNIELSTDNGSTWATLAASAPNSGAYQILTPNTPSSWCLIKISDANGPSFDVSNAAFTIKELSSITVTTPNGGEYLMVGTNPQIQWTYSGLSDSSQVIIEASQDGGATWNTNGLSSFPTSISQGFTNWAIEESMTGNSCLIRVRETSGIASDTSDAPFVIGAMKYLNFTLPTPLIWTEGSTQPIRWVSTGTMPLLILEYSTDEQQTWNMISSVVPNTGEYSWLLPNIPNNPASQCVLRITDPQSTLSVISTPFTIIGPEDCIPLAERNALIALYNATGGDSWTNKNNWRHPDDPQQFNVHGSESLWYGVTLSADLKHVIKLNLSNNWVSGPVPDLNNLTELTELVLSANNLATGTADIFSNLLHLTVLELNMNGFTGPLQGLNNLVNLTRLELSNNDFSGTIPELTNLTGLTKLDLAGNNLSGAIPSFSTLVNLTSLTLTSNVLSGSIPSFANLGNLTQLRLGSNQLTGTIYHLNNLTQLTTLTLGSNNFNGTIPNFSNLTGLTRLELQMNSFTGSVPTFTSHPNLTYLYLGKNQLSGSIPNLGNLPNLTELSLSNNQLSGTIPDLQYLSNLKNLYLDGNQLTGTIPDSLLFLSAPGKNAICLLNWNALTTANTTLINWLSTIDPNWATKQTTAPTALTIADVTASSLQLSWDNSTLSPNINGYMIYRSTTSGNDYQLIETITSRSQTSYTATGLASETTYYFTIKSFTSPFSYNQNTVISEASAAVSATTIQSKSITLTSPNGGESTEVDVILPITWNYTGSIPNVKIEYSTDAAFTWTTIAASTSNTGSYNWTVPNTPANMCLIKVSDAAGTSTDSSNAYFTILAPLTFTLLTPNGSESLETGTNKTISWSNSRNVANVKLEYTTDGGTSWNIISASTPNTTGTYVWTVPNTPSTNCLVKVSDAAGTAFDTSNAPFSILTARSITLLTPNGGESTEVDAILPITWNYTGSIPNVKIEYTTNGAGTWTTLTPSTTNTGSYNWTVPNTPANMCLIKVSDAAGTSTDSSNAYFTILAPLTFTLLTPNGSESLETGTNKTISWSNSRNVANVKLEYTTDGGTSWNIISASTPNTTGTYVWTVPNTPSTNCLVKVSDAAGTAFDTSNAPFSIVTARSITLLAPNGGESFEIGATLPITWNYTGSIANVKIEYTTNGASTWTTLTPSTSNTGTYNWTVPNAPANNCLMKISDAAGTSTDSSNAVFTILAPLVLNVITPNGGESVEAGNTHTIAWTNNRSVSNLKIEYTTNNGSSWNTIIASTPNTTGSYLWSVPNTPSANCLVKVSDAAGTVFDTSNATFTITPPRTLTLTAPNGGQSWSEGTTQSITWTYTGPIAYVAISYSINNGSTWNTIQSYMTNTGSYSWVIPSVDSTTCLIKVSDADSSVTDISNSTFSIWRSPSITVTAPNGGESWKKSTTHPITWTSTGNISTVKLQYTLNGGTSWTTITTSTANTSTYQWLLPSVSSNKTACKVKIIANGVTAQDTSNANFTILK